MKPFHLSLRSKLFWAIVATFLLVSFVVQLTLWLVLQPSGFYSNQPLKDWQRTGLVAPIEQQIATKPLAQAATALDSFCQPTAPVEIMYWQQSYARISIKSLLVADPSGKPVWSCESQVPDKNLFLSLPMQSRDDLADAVTSQSNSGVEHFGDDQYLVVKAIENSDGEVLGLLVSNQHWRTTNTFNHWLNTPSKALIQAVRFSLGNLLWGLPSAMLIAFFIARLISRRLSSLSVVIGHWSKGNFKPRLEVSGTAQIADSLHQLNQLALAVESLLANQKQQVQLSERQRIAAELHDTVKQLLFANNLQLAGCQQALGKPHNTPNLQAIQFLQTALDNNQQAFEQINQLIDALKPDAFIGEGFWPALHQMMADWSALTGVSIDSKITEIADLDAQVCHLIHRCIQEALQNVSKHSAATRVVINLSQHDQTLQLMLHDNDKNARLQPFGQGLLLMQSRLQTLNGTVNANSENGYQLKIRIPL